jgi:DNA-3-methyladenine glycosylase II
MVRASMSFLNISDRRIFRLGAKHISSVDPELRQLIIKQGLIEFKAGGGLFESLVEAIISQQLNGQAATAIFKRLKALVRSETIEAHALSRIPVSKLRRAGVSPQKIRYLRDLSSRVVRDRLDLNNLRKLPDEEVVRVLDEVMGIGPWTAQMFLLFTLGRSDVLPVDDLGIQMAIQRTYSLRKPPDARRIRKIASNWHPYCSVASLYLWHSKDT